MACMSVVAIPLRLKIDCQYLHSMLYELETQRYPHPCQGLFHRLAIAVQEASSRGLGKAACGIEHGKLCSWIRRSRVR